MKLTTSITSAVVVISLLAGCQQGSGDTTPRDYSAHFSAVSEQTPFPEANPFSEEKAKLGEFLFWDPILSGEQNVACASCHHPDFGWADGRAFSIGVDGVGLGPDRIGFAETQIHAPTIANTAYTGFGNLSDPNNFTSGPYFWDLRAQTLEEQSIGPIANAIEMRGEHVSEQDIYPIIEARLANIHEYQALFEAAFPQAQSITIELVAQALATYQRTINGRNTRFDQFIAGDTSVFTKQEISGINTFIDVGCARCHSGPMLSDNLIHQGQPILRGLPEVRTPSLRNVSATAPYMHTGERETLRSAIAIYEERGDLQVTMDEDHVSRIEAFLRTLDTPNMPREIPSYVPSGLPIGGDIH